MYTYGICLPALHCTHEQGVTNCGSAAVQALDACHLNSTGALHPSEALSRFGTTIYDTVAICGLLLFSVASAIVTGLPRGKYLSLAQHASFPRHWNYMIMLVWVSQKGQAEEVPGIILRELLSKSSYLVWY